MQPMRRLTALAIRRQDFAPYGWLIDATGTVGRPINEGTSLRLDGLSELALGAEGGSPCLALFRAQARDPAGPWREMERHRLGTQSFIPLNGAHFVVLVALGGERPEPATLAAFRVAGNQAVTLRAGTWHHALLAPAGGDFVVLERQAAQIDCEFARLPEAVQLALG